MDECDKVAISSENGKEKLHPFVARCKRVIVDLDAPGEEVFCIMWAQFPCFQVERSVIAVNQVKVSIERFRDNR